MRIYRKNNEPIILKPKPARSFNSLRGVATAEIIKRTLQSCRRITLIEAIRGIAERK